MMEQEITRLHAENVRLQAEIAGLELANRKLREYFREANLRTIINTRHVQIWGEIKVTLDRVRNLEQLPISAINYIDTLVNVVEEEATPHGITG